MSSIECRTAHDPQAWDAFLLRATSPPEFLQSWKWGTFQEKAGKRIVRLNAVRGSTVLAVALLVPHTTRLRRSFFLCPRGPIVDPGITSEDQQEVWRILMASMSTARTPDTMFLKIEPNVSPPQGLDLVKGSGMHPEQTLLIDLTKSETQLLSEMHPKTRYNIGLAERHGVTVDFSRSAEAVEQFLGLLHATATRQKIGIYPPAYYRTMVQELGDDVEITIARLNGAPLAASLLIRFGSTTTYAHGASSGEHREVMAPHLLQWQSIVYAKHVGCTTYDFFGIAPPHDADHRWKGITRFKLGFGGTIHVYSGAYNLVYQRGWYLAYRFAKRLRGK